MTISESARAEAREFVEIEKQFQLGFLPKEQSNSITATSPVQVALKDLQPLAENFANEDMI